MKFYIGSGFQNAVSVNEYAKALEENGWEHTYNWTRNINGDITVDDLIQYAEAEKKAIADSDVVIILLPAGRGAHIELGMALALQKKVFLCSAAEEAFSVENTVNFYQLPEMIKLTGAVDENIGKILAEYGFPRDRIIN